MEKYITLLGAESVSSAGSAMKAAAETMRQAAASIDESLTRHKIFLEEWLTTLEAIMSENK